MTAVKILAALLVLVTGCARNPALRSEIPPTEQQRGQAAASGSRLRDQFNQNDCVGIYREGALNFRFQREKDWLNDCANLRTDLGNWRTYTIKTTARCGLDGTVCTDGLATFEKTSMHVELGWMLDKGQARLMWVTIESQGQMQAFPGIANRFADPPPTHPPGAA